MTTDKTQIRHHDNPHGAYEKQLMSSAVVGKVFYVKDFRIIITKELTDISFKGRGVVLFHPFTKRFSFKQYVLLYTWVLNGKF